MVPLGLAVVGVAVALLSQVNGLAALVVVEFGIGLAIAPVTGAVSTLLQREAPGPTLGRVAASLNVTVTLASVGSMALAASLATWPGVRGVFVASGVVCLVAAGLAAVLLRPAGATAGHPAERP